MIVKFLFLIIPFFKNDSSTNCIDDLVDAAFKPKFNANYFLFLPVKTNKGKERLLILKDNLQKYMIALDSSYVNNDSIKKYVKDVLKNKREFFFHEFFYKEKFGQEEYRLFNKTNKFDLIIKKSKNKFLEKYISNYDEKNKYFNLHDNIPINDSPFIYEQLFRLNFLVANRDGSIGVFKVSCTTYH